MVWAMPSLVKSFNPPVTTKVNPAKVCGSFLTGASTIATPAALHLIMIALCQSIENHSTIDSAIVAPTPSISASSAADAFEIFSIDPKELAKACAAVGPTCRIESATSVLHNGSFFADSSAANNLSIFAPGVPSFLVKKSERISFS